MINYKVLTSHWKAHLAEGDVIPGDMYAESVINRAEANNYIEPVHSGTTKGRCPHCGETIEQAPQEERELQEDAVEDIETAEKPTMSHTKKEIEQYLDANGIEYDEYATKPELLELIE